MSIDEVLRLLTRSRQQGCVDVTGNGLHGRVFVGKGGVDLATISDNDDLHRHLLNSGYTDERTLSRITSGETTLAAVADKNHPLIDLIREMTVESLYQIADRGEDFRVYEGVTTPYASPKSFELETLLHDTDERRREWVKVAELIPDLTGRVAFRRDLGEREEVTVKVDDWKVLSEIGAGLSVRDIADHLGTTEFWTARVAARLINNDLVALVGDDAVSVDVEEPGYQTITDERAPVDEYAAYEAEKTSDYEVVEDDPVEEIEVPVFESGQHRETSDHDESWWQEPNEEEAVDHEGSATPEVVGEDLSEIPAVGAADSTPDSDVEEDTEAFLEKVFSELESSEPEAEEGHGLLRRRRMGMLRDFSSDS